MNNCIYGKTIRSIRKRLIVDLIDKSDTHRLQNCQSNICLDDKIGQYEKIILYSFHKENIKMRKPIYVGFCVLEITKIIMYQWF